VLAAIDAYARSDSYLMNVGAQKGAIVTSLIAEVAPKVMIELGGYIGYSTILFAAAARKANPAARYFSFERNPEFAAVISSLVDLAGLRDTVRVVVGPSDEGIVRAKQEGLLGAQIDMMFLDHYKPAYTTDLKLCEQLGLVGKGTVLAADNVVTPGNPRKKPCLGLCVLANTTRSQLTSNTCAPPRPRSAPASSPPARLRMPRRLPTVRLSNTRRARVRRSSMPRVPATRTWCTRAS